MKSGQCPKCGSHEVHASQLTGYRSVLQITIWNTARLTTYACASCGYLEDYVEDSDKRQIIRGTWPKVN